MTTKFFTLLLGIIITVWPHYCLPSQNLTNAKLVNYKFGRFQYSYFLLIPNNINDYKYLSHYPFTAFVFLHYYDKDKIKNLTVKELKSLSLGSSNSSYTSDFFYDVLKYDKLKGFEEIAHDLKEFDEFQIAEKKNDIISMLINIYEKYKSEYFTYLEGIDGTYKFRKGNFHFPVWKKLKEYNDNVEIYESSPQSFYERVDINDYDFDKKILSIEPLGSISVRGLTTTGWEYHYKKKIRHKYLNMEWEKKPILQNIEFPDEIQIHVSLDDAKKLFKRGHKVVCETILTVKPEKGAFGYEGNAVYIMTSNFNIVNITKNYYSTKNWSSKENLVVGDPIYSIELKPNEKRYLY